MPAKSKLHLAGCVIIKDRSILLLHRIKHDWYELPGGKIEAGETAEQAALREIKEELGCDVVIHRVLGTHDFNYKDETLGYTWFLASLKEGQTPQVGEPDKFSSYEFIPLDQLEDYPLSTNMKNLVADLKSGAISLSD